jgi:hypothetical protein
MNRREMMISSLAAAGAFCVPELARANTISMERASGFRYLPAAGNPFSSGVVALEGYALSRFRFRSPMPLADGLAVVARKVKSLGCRPSALAGLELRAPRRMTRPGFMAFNKNYLAQIKLAGVPIGDTVSIARSDMVPKFDPPTVDSLVAFTVAVPRKTSVANTIGPDFLVSGRPEHASNPDRVIAPGDHSPAAMDQKARFVWDALRQTVADLGGHWQDISGTQIYMTEPFETILPATQAAGVLSTGLTVFPGETPVIGFGEAPYAFEADVRAISNEELL